MIHAENIFPKNNTIRELNAHLSRRICTGQVIVSLAGACRELIDNAVDAGATNIEIRVTENGLECLEVIDNGTGISSSNFDHLCKPHSTSKLSDLADFRSLTTFGFRGEALNALAALGDVQITTRDANSRCATRLTFGRNGEQLANEQCSRSQGTTVRVAHLFKPLPVRRAEFQRQSRREFLRLIDCVQAFAIALLWCRFTCTNSANGGKRLTVLCTPGGPSTGLPQVIDSLFGAANGKSNGRSGGLLMLDQLEGMPSDDCLQLFGVRSPMSTPAELEKIFSEIKLSGYVSSCQTGDGRSSADRQFVFVNQRHVDFSKLYRIANEVYAQFNRGRFCCLVLFVDVPPHTLDVNISPDKRTVFLHYEKEVFAKFRATLFATFSKAQGHCSMVTPGSMSGPANTNGSSEAKKRRRTLGSLLRWDETLACDGNDQKGQTLASRDDPVGLTETQQSVDLSCMTFANAERMGDGGEQQNSIITDDDDDQFDRNSQRAQKGSVDADCWSNDSNNVSTKMTQNCGKKRKTTVKLTAGQKALEAFSFQRLRTAGPSRVMIDHRPDCDQQREQQIAHDAVDPFLLSSNHIVALKNEPPNSQKSSQCDDCPSAQLEFVVASSPDSGCCPPSSPSSSSLAMPNSQQCCSSSSSLTISSAAVFQSQSQQEQKEFGDDCVDDDDEAIIYRPQQIVHVDMDILRKNFAIRCAQKRRNPMRQNDDHHQQWRVKTTIVGPTTSDNNDGIQHQGMVDDDTEEAMERRLSMMLKKTDFARMRLIGQFNNAFIIVRLHTDLFIIDQHAADEKFNFERLLAQSVIKSQRLIRPQHLHLGSVNAALIRDNLHVFRANGFDFQFNNNDNDMKNRHQNDENAEIVVFDKDADNCLTKSIDECGPGIDMNDDVILSNNDENQHDGDKLGTVLLTAVPMLHGWQLNRDDIDQLLAMLTELPGAMHRPAKVRKIFASKACRHSVMFGKALTQHEMETIVSNMGSMDQPWNCPHGRPTIRFLCSVEKKSG